MGALHPKLYEYNLAEVGFNCSKWLEMIETYEEMNCSQYIYNMHLENRKSGIFFHSDFNLYSLE